MSLLDALEKAKPADLSDIDVLLVEKEREINALRQVRRILDVRFNGKQHGPRKKSAPSANGAPPQAGGRSPTLKEKAAKYLLHAGPTKIGSLAQAIDASSSGVHTAIERDEDDWFAKTPAGLTLTAKGRTAAEAL